MGDRLQLSGVAKIAFFLKRAAMSSKKVPARTRHALALVGLGQQQSYCKFKDKSLTPKEKRP